VWAGDDSSDEASTEPAKVQANAAPDDASHDGVLPNPAQDDAAGGGDDGTDDGGVAPNDRLVTIQLYVFVFQGIHKAKITPLWDAWNNCVENANTPGEVEASHGPEFGRFIDLTVTATGGGLFESCSYEESRMHWQIKFANGSTFTVESHTPAGGATTAACGPDRDVYNCTGVDGYGDDTIAVPI
jgi:hypothetical protein